MSFFFRHTPTVEVNFSAQNVAGTAGGDAIFVSQDVWDKLYFSNESRRLVSVKPKRLFQDRSRLPTHVTTLTCWAICRPTVSEISVPPAWLLAYPVIFRPFRMSCDGSVKSLIVSPTESAILTEVVLTAKHEDAFMAASVYGSALENWFFETQVIIRGGEDVYVPSNILSAYGLPLQQASSLGYFVNLTLPYKQGIAQRGLTRFVVTSSDGSSTEKMNNYVSPENLEINESFLVSAALSYPEPLFQEHDGVGVLEDVFIAKTLSSPIDADLDPVTVYICTASLRSLGVLNGDWALASSVNSPTSRLVRVSTLDEAFSDSCKQSAVLSPTLLHNLCPHGCGRIMIRTSPYGNRDPGIPTARSITLARVPSPFSIHRRHESLFIDALHEYFGSSKRLVKDGDIVPLQINIDRSLDPRYTLGPEDFSHGAGKYRSVIAIYFVVRNLGYEPTTTQMRGPISDVGCFVDTHVTRIIQVGVEHAKVPDMYDYFNLGHSRAMLPAVFGISRQISQLSNAMSLEEGASFGVRSTVFLTGPRGAGRLSAAVRLARYLRMHLVEINCFDVLSDTNMKSESSLRERVTNAISCSPSLIVLRHVEALNHSSTAEGGKGSLILQQAQMLIDEANRQEGRQCILLGIVESDKIPEGISFSNEIEVKALSQEERFYLLSEQVESQGGECLVPDTSLSVLAKQTAAFVASDLVNLVHSAHLCAVANSATYHSVAHLTISIKQFEMALLKARKAFSRSIGAPSIPKVFWEDVGGLSSVKHDILDTVQLPLDHPELFQDGLKKRSGILLYGPPGTGKTLLAKAVATSCSLNFFSVKGPELLNMYIGESEANVRRIFQRARDAKPCVIFFDELDSVAPKRGNQGDSGGVMDRIVSQLLAELDGMSIGGMDVFVIGATNRPDLLDPALLRPGRFDKMLYLGVCETHEAQLDILKALTRKFNLHPTLDLASIAAQSPFNYTGADFYALCADALLHALSSKVMELEKERAGLNALSKYMQHPISPQFFIAEMKTEADLQLVVKAEDFEFALKELTPSITMSELLLYTSIQKNQ